VFSFLRGRSRDSIRRTRFDHRAQPMLRCTPMLYEYTCGKLMFLVTAVTVNGDRMPPRPAGYPVNSRTEARAEDYRRVAGAKPRDAAFVPVDRDSEAAAYYVLCCVKSYAKPRRGCGRIFRVITPPFG